MQKFRDKRMMGHVHIANQTKVKQIMRALFLAVQCAFVYFGHTAIFKFTMLTYLCIHCSQSFTLENYFVGDKDILIEKRQKMKSTL